MARLKAANGIEIGPLRVWPGGLCLSRSIGDMDLGDYIVAVPDVKQIKVSFSSPLNGQHGVKIFSH